MTEAMTLPWPAGTTIHLVGVGGAGMSSLAIILRDAGYLVTGSDLAASSTVEDLRRRGIPVQVGHHAENVGSATFVIRSSAVPRSNPEVSFAASHGIPVLKHSEALGALTRVRRTVAVAGTHGKTTTTAMLATILFAAGFDPTVLIGGVVPTLGSGAHWGTGDLLVAEADEFDRRFLDLYPEIAIVNNVEADHLDYYASLAEIIAAFRAFVAAVPPEGWIILCADDPGARQLADVQPDRTVTYGLSEHADWRAVGLSVNDLGGTDFYIVAHETLIGRCRLRVPGRHNVQNALAALVAAGRVGVDLTAAAAALERFPGVRRRFERLGTVRGITVVDDYAHNPTKVRATLAAAREQHPGRIICLFQPHTYDRLRTLFDAFTRAFGDADLVIVTDVYSPAGRERGPHGARTGRDLAAAIVGTAACYGGDLAAAVELTARLARPGDLIITMGAGDVTAAGPRLLALLAQGGA